MRPERLGASCQTRLSFVRSLVRQMTRERWRIERERFELDENGYGSSAYAIHAGGERYSLVVFSHHLDDAERTDRVIARKWDVACALCEGPIDAERAAALAANVPLQEAGRMPPGVLVLSRANKSVRNFEHVVDCLAAGRQPEPEALRRVGYLLRTTAVYGNGKFGLLDYERVRRSRAFGRPFAAQLFTVYLLRHFSIELAEHLARVRDPRRAVPLDAALARYLGTGNATGLGMAPFLVRHPRLLDRWVGARETAIARVVAAGAVSAERLVRLGELAGRAARHARETVTADERQARSYAQTARELEALAARVAAAVRGERPIAGWGELLAWAASEASAETEELVASLLLELHPELVDELEECMDADERLELRSDVSAGRLVELLERHYDWALAIDYAAPGAEHFFWYRSAEKQEPRLGERDREPGAEREIKLTAVARDVARLHAALAALSPAERAQPVARFLLQRPDLAGLVRRVQSLAGHDYAEVCGNLLDREVLPIHLLRCKLSFFGATKFDPKSRLWVRITLFQGAPLVSDIGWPFADDWCFPCVPGVRTGAVP